MSSTSVQYPPPGGGFNAPDAPSIDPNTPQQRQQPQHKRVYQACIPCRRRKVKCDLGSVDNPGDPPCVRCRRESKECYFSATRRKRKTDDGREDSVDGTDFGDDYVSRNGRKSLYGSGSPQASNRQSSMSAPSIARSGAPYQDTAAVNLGPPLTPGGSIGRREPLRRPRQTSPEAPTGRQRQDRNSDENEPNTQLENFEAQEVMRREVYGPHDALDLLYKAATDNSSPIRRRSDSNHRPSPLLNHTPKLAAKQDLQSRNTHNTTSRQDAAIDPALSENQPDRTQDAGYAAAVKAWSRFRFVRAGWFTPNEAIDYIEYYYENLSPLTPISPPTFRYPGTHTKLLTEEPILTVTLLTIATRYRKVPGPGGHCRSHAIHEQLWTYLRGMIERCLWGQEAFGGGFCGSGGDTEAQTSSTAPWRGMRKGSLRTLGTIESLMILTEWHPRALHFPPAEATDELILPSYDMPDNYSINNDDDIHQLPGGVGGRRIESWLEPAWRSDRMCWMLLSTAMGLSYELGVFDKFEEVLASGGEMMRPEYEDEAYRLRAARIKRLLLIYVTQLAGRLGWTNMVPENLRVNDPVFAARKRRSSTDGRTPDTNTTVSNTFSYIPDLDLDDQIIHCWAGISNAMRIGNEKLFRSRQHTTKIIQDGSYVELLKDFQPMLSAWKQEFNRFRLPPYIRHILTIEYEYVRIYVNSLSLQAVIERCTSKTGNHANTGKASGSGVVPGTAMPLSPETQNYYGKMPLATLGGFSPADQSYVKEVVEGSRNLLQTVVKGLLPGGFLMHAPVRTYFRIISGAMFLLKSFTLGAAKKDVEISIGLMDEAVKALRTCVVDDVHLGIRFANLLENLTSRLRSRFISAPPAAPGNGESVDGGQSPAVHHDHEPAQKRQKFDSGDQVREWNAGTANINMSNGGAEPHVSATPFSSNGAFYPNTPYGHTSGSTFGPDISSQYLAGGTDWDGSGSEMWYIPPGAAFFGNITDQTITQTAEGVNVGGMDLLDYMAYEPDQYSGMDGSNGF